MHVTAWLAGQFVDVYVGEDCRTVQALREAIVVALPQLCAEGFDVSVGGRALDNDEGVVSLEEDSILVVVASPRGLSIRALREAGHEVSVAGLHDAADKGNVRTNRGQDSGAAGAGTRGTGRTSGSFDERARSATAPAVRLVVRIGTAAGLVVQGQQEGHTRGRVVCVGIDNPGSNVSPSSSPVWQWGGARF